MKLAEESRIQLEPTVGGNRTLLDGRDVSERIRERDVTEAASRVSVHPGVRVWMVAHQREMGAGGGVVMEGRDIGTKVFPDADLKIFLDADPVVREQRRMEQQRIKGEVAERSPPNCANATTATAPVQPRRCKRPQTPWYRLDEAE